LRLSGLPVLPEGNDPASAGPDRFLDLSRASASPGFEIEIFKRLDTSYVLFAPSNDRIEHISQAFAFFGESIRITDRPLLIRDAPNHPDLLQPFQPIG
jgi:hypothetical protein